MHSLIKALAARLLTCYEVETGEATSDAKLHLPAPECRRWHGRMPIKGAGVMEITGARICRELATAAGASGPPRQHLGTSGGAGAYSSRHLEVAFLGAASSRGHWGHAQTSKRAPGPV